MKKILISGASIAGPTLAFWLRRRGFEVTMVERAAAIRKGGYAIDVRGPALAVVERMGILPRMREQSTDTLSNAFVDERGRHVVTFDRGFGVLHPEDVEIMRGDLAQILYELTRADVPYWFDDSITALAQDADGVQVSFARRPPERFDLVIGADGLHSNVRALAFGPEEQFVRLLGSAIAIFTARNHAQLDRAQHMLMTKGRVVSIKSDRGNAEVKVTLMFSSPPVDRRDPDAQKQATLDAFATLGGPVPALLADLKSAPDFYFDMTAQVRMPRWHEGRVVLVGDAAYGPSPMTGQGTSLALTGAYILAQALADPPDFPSAFRQYESTMRDFVLQNQDVAAGVAKGFAPTSAFGAWFRNANLRILPYLPWRDFVFRLMMRDIARASTALSLDSPSSIAGA
jgi:2-polyprenyl-6-methoxyphenol hydroxylase-like FAD-dependent oxidoreductase